MDVKSRSLGNFPSTTASNFWDFPTKPGQVDCRLLPTSWIKLSPQGGKFPTIPIRTGEDDSKTITSLQMSPRMLPLNPVLITCYGVLLIHAPPDAASTTTSFAVGVNSVCGANISGAIPWSISWLIKGVKTGIVQ